MSAPFTSAWSERDRVARRPGDPGLFLSLAPMDGVTDACTRGLLCELFGGRSGISLCVSEFVRVVHQPVPAHVLVEHCPELSRAPALEGLGSGGATSSGVPVQVQLLGSDPDAMAETAARAVELGAWGIDLNFGCPAKTVNSSDGGATLLKQPCRVEAVTAAVRARVDPSIPVSAKVRIGWDSSEPIVEIARAAEAGGATWLTVHGRTRKQLYRPPVDWQAIGRARAAVGIPVVANGDLVDEASVRACAEQSGCSAFMIGRASMGRPELFAQLRGARAEPLSGDEWVALLLEYVSRLHALVGDERVTLGRLKQWLRMGAPLRAELSEWFEQIKRVATLEQARALLQDRELAAAE